MIFYSFNQLNNVLIFIFFGLILCFIYNIFEIVFLLNLQKKLKNVILNSVFCVISALFFIILSNIFNFGLFSITLLMGSVFGFIWFKFVSKNLVVFLKNKCYTIFNKTRKGTKCKPIKKKLKR